MIQEAELAISGYSLTCFFEKHKLNPESFLSRRETECCPPTV